MTEARVTHINPPTLYDSVKYGLSQIITVEGGKLVLISGQPAYDVAENPIGAGDIKTQITAALDNVRLALAAAGATPADVVQMRTYIVGYKPEHLAIFTPLVRAFYPAATPPTAVLVGVETLAVPNILVEIEVMAVVR